MKNVSVRKNLHSIFCLSFIPEDGVVPTPMLGLTEANTISESFLAACLGLCGVIYQIHMWNVYNYKAVIDGGLRTNKFPEEHNHALQLTAGCSHPGIELVVEIPTLYNTGAEFNIQ